MRTVKRQALMATEGDRQTQGEDRQRQSNSTGRQIDRWGRSRRQIMWTDRPGPQTDNQGEGETEVSDKHYFFKTKLYTHAGYSVLDSTSSITYSNNYHSKNKKKHEKVRNRDF